MKKDLLEIFGVGHMIFKVALTNMILHGELGSRLF